MTTAVQERRTAIVKLHDIGKQDFRLIQTLITLLFLLSKSQILYGFCRAFLDRIPGRTPWSRQDCWGNLRVYINEAPGQTDQQAEKHNWERTVSHGNFKGYGLPTYPSHLHISFVNGVWISVIYMIGVGSHQQQSRLKLEPRLPPAQRPVDSA